MEKDNTRREFLQTFSSGLAGIMVVGFVAPVFEACSSATDTTTITPTPFTVDVSSLDADLKAIRTNSPSGVPLFIIRRSATTYTTLKLVCTHMACAGTSLEQLVAKIQCQCHGSEYDFDGHVIHGPATIDLTSYTTVYDAATKKVTITFS